MTLMTAKLLVQISWREPDTRWQVDLTALQMQIEQDTRNRALQATSGRVPSVEVIIEERPADETPKPCSIAH